MRISFYWNDIVYKLTFVYMEIDTHAHIHMHFFPELNWNSETRNVKWTMHVRIKCIYENEFHNNECIFEFSMHNAVDEKWENKFKIPQPIVLKVYIYKILE